MCSKSVRLQILFRGTILDSTTHLRISEPLGEERIIVGVKLHFSNSQSFKYTVDASASAAYYRALNAPCYVRTRRV